MKHIYRLCSGLLSALLLLLPAAADAYIPPEGFGFPYLKVIALVLVISAVCITVILLLNHKKRK